MWPGFKILGSGAVLELVHTSLFCVWRRLSMNVPDSDLMLCAELVHSGWRCQCQIWGPVQAAAKWMERGSTNGSKPQKKGKTQGYYKWNSSYLLWRATCSHQNNNCCLQYLYTCHMVSAKGWPLGRTIKGVWLCQRIYKGMEWVICPWVEEIQDIFQNQWIEVGIFQNDLRRIIWVGEIVNFAPCT